MLGERPKSSAINIVSTLFQPVRQGFGKEQPAHFYHSRKEDLKQALSESEFGVFSQSEYTVERFQLNPTSAVPRIPGNAPFASQHPGDYSLVKGLKALEFSVPRRCRASVLGRAFRARGAVCSALGGHLQRKMSQPKNVVMVLPHQDDEMFIFHRIRHLVSKSAHVFIVWMTDGAANNPQVRQELSIRLFFPTVAHESDDTLRRIRKSESRSLMRHLGIPQENLHFLSFPSGQIQDSFSHIVHALTNVFAELRPQEIYTVAFDHCEFEHDACNAAVTFAARRWSGTPKLYEFPVFNSHGWRPRLQRLVPHKGAPVQRTPFTGKEESERLCLFRHIFKSQSRAAWLVRLGSHLSLDYRRHGEPYRLMPAYDYTQPVQGARVTYMPKGLRFEDFKEMILHYLTREREKGHAANNRTQLSQPR